MRVLYLLFLNLNDRKEDHFLVKFYLLHPVRGSFLSMDKQFDELKLVSKKQATDQSNRVILIKRG